MNVDDLPDMACCQNCQTIVLAETIVCCRCLDKSVERSSKLILELVKVTRERNEFHTQRNDMLGQRASLIHACKAMAAFEMGAIADALALIARIEQEKT